jgi:hypothetical protein
MLAWWFTIGNCDVDFFVFRYCFQIMSPKFPKFERVQNSAAKIQTAQKRKRKITKLNEMDKILANFCNVL